MEIPFEYLVLALLVAIAYFWRVGYTSNDIGEPISLHQAVYKIFVVQLRRMSKV